MIQRIQTLYLLVSLILVGILVWLDLGEIVAGDQLYLFNMKGIVAQSDGSVVYNGLPLTILMVMVLLLQLLVIFSYKKRILQMRAATLNLLLMLGIVGLAWFFVHNGVQTLGEGVYQFKLPMAFPVVAAILNYLAIRAIARDEALVRSIDRIR
ncbi:MAG: DUF4293 domain-containing protein [Prolixibacteraceae bacterium]|nr:DUF4293 domain-containing protein [Prolixibacteraceae bacterium]